MDTLGIWLLQLGTAMLSQEYARTEPFFGVLTSENVR
jgi:hypothetical protein